MKKRKRIVKRNSSDKKIGYAIVGLGWISQAAALPSFQHAAKNSKVVALVSSDPKKLKELGQKYKVPHLYLADQYDECLQNPEVDAVYIALPNALHAEYAIRAAQFGKHVLCEKPLAVTVSDCEKMMDACSENNVKLMTAYRLHFDKANLQAIETVKSGKIGTPRIFTSVFSYKVSDPNNYRLQFEMGGGPLFDIGIYCINAARYLFQSEPTTVTAFYGSGGDSQFAEVEETVSAILQFPQGMSATFACSFGAADESYFEVIGTKGKLRMEKAYELFDDREQRVTVEEKEQRKTFPKSDQFAPEFLYFSDCILSHKQPEPSGLEGLIDVEIIQALYHSMHSGQAVEIGKLPRKAKPNRKLELTKPAFPEQKLIHAVPPAA